MVAMFQCFHGARSSHRARAVSSQPQRNWIQTIRDIFKRKKKTPPRDEEQGLMTPPSTQQHNVHAYGTFYSHGNAQISPTVLEETLHDPNTHLDELREYFPGFDGAPVTPSSPPVSTPTPASAQTGHNRPRAGHLRPRPIVVSPVASSVYPDSSANSDSESTSPARLEPCPESFASDYAVIKTLKRNNEGPVHLVKCRTTGERFIIKQMCYLTTPDGQQSDPHEIDAMSLIKYPHRNCIRCEWIIDDRPRGISNMVLEYCAAGDCEALLSTCMQRAEHIPAEIILHITSGLIDATAFLHHGDVSFDPVTDKPIHTRSSQRPLLHRDIKPGNIFLRWSESNQYGLPDAVLADYGMANTVSKSLTEYRCGTSAYYAPECVPRVQGVCTQKSDMYALGVTLFELISGDTYEFGDNIAQAFDCSSVRDHPRFLRLLETCLSPDPAERPAADSLHRTSYVFKQHVREWYEAGGRIPDSFWPSPFANDRYIRGDGPQHSSQSESHSSRSPPPHYSQVSSPVQPNAPSMTAAVAHLPPLRRVGRLSNIQAAAGAQYAQEIADIPGPFTPTLPSFGSNVGIFSAESNQATAGEQAPRDHFSWGSDESA